MLKNQVLAAGENSLFSNYESFWKVSIFGLPQGEALPDLKRVDFIWLYLNVYNVRLECIHYEAWMSTARGLKIYSMRSESIQYDCVWGLKVYTMRPESIHYQAWMYTIWGLKAYTVRPECMQHDVWKHTLWGLKVYSTRPVSITVLGLEVYSMSLENIQYDSMRLRSWIHWTFHTIPSNVFE